MHRTATVPRLQRLAKDIPICRIIIRHYIADTLTCCPSHLAATQLRKAHTRGIVHHRRKRTGHQTGAHPEKSIQILLRRHSAVNLRHRLVHKRHSTKFTLHPLHRSLEKSKNLGTLDICREHKTTIRQPCVRSDHTTLAQTSRQKRPQPTPVVEHQRNIGKPIGMIIHISAHKQKGGIFCSKYKIVPLPSPFGTITNNLHQCKSIRNTMRRYE